MYSVYKFEMDGWVCGWNSGWVDGWVFCKQEQSQNEVEKHLNGVLVSTKNEFWVSLCTYSSTWQNQQLSDDMIRELDERGLAMAKERQVFVGRHITAFICMCVDWTVRAMLALSSCRAGGLSVHSFDLVCNILCLLHICTSRISVVWKVLQTIFWPIFTCLLYPKLSDSSS